MSRWPLELVFLSKVKSERVAPGVDLVTDVTLIFGHPLNLKVILLLLNYDLIKYYLFILIQLMRTMHIN